MQLFSACDLHADRDGLVPGVISQWNTIESLEFGVVNTKVGGQGYCDGDRGHERVPAWPGYGAEGKQRLCCLRSRQSAPCQNGRSEERRVGKAWRSGGGTGGSD